MAALSEQMHCASRQLAACIEAGEFDALSVEQRFQLRWLALGIETWADRVETEEREAADRLCRRTNRRLTKAAVLIWSVNGAAAAVVALILGLR